MNNIPKRQLERFLPHVQAIAREAGAILMYYSQHGADITIKQDGSPVTEADHASHRHILKRLKTLSPDIPIISEENETHPEIEGGKAFWTVDPLDGTKGFINGVDPFFVKIALIENFKPVLGVIYQPGNDTMYFSWDGGKPFRQKSNAPVETIATRKAPQKGELTTVFNRLHSNPDAYVAARAKLALRNLAIPKREDADGHCKTAFFMAVARGEADAYLDCGSDVSLENGNGYSWDYAPDSLILKNAGGIVIEINSGQERLYNKPTSRMNACIGLGDKELGEKAFPEFKNHCL